MQVKIEEHNGLQRSIVLVGTTRPHKMLHLPVGQRLSTTYYTGSPVAFQRVSGPEFGPTLLTGRWADRLIREADRPRLIGFGPLLGDGAGMAQIGEVAGNSGDVGGSQARNVMEIAAAIELLTRAAALIRFEWGPLVRYGRIKMFDPGWGTVREAEWSLEFEWIGDQADQPLAPPPEPTLAGFIEKLANFRDKVLGLADRLAGYPILRIIEAPLGELEGTILALIKDLELATATVLAPKEIVGSVRSSYENIRSLAQSFIDTIARETPGRRESAERDSTKGSLSAMTLRVIMGILEQLMEECMLRQAEIDAMTKGATQEEFVVPDYMGLRQVSTKFFGTPNNWTTIANHNGLSSSVVVPGQKIKIPRIG